MTISSFFQDTLLPCSWNGIEFFVLAAEIKAGQRAAVHQYPYRNTPYTEPLGRAARQYVITGYLVGDDLNAQYSEMLDAIESQAPGELVHPSLGFFTVVCLQAECTQTTAGRYVEIKFTFVEAGELLFPTTGIDTQSETINAAADGQNASERGFQNSVTGAGSGAETQKGNYGGGFSDTVPTGIAQTGAGLTGTIEIPATAITQTNQSANDALVAATASVIQ